MRYIVKVIDGRKQFVDSTGKIHDPNLAFNAENYEPDSEILELKSLKTEPALKGDGTPLTLEELIQCIETSVGAKEFKPFVLYNEHGDILHVLWENKDYHVEWLGPAIEICKSQDTIVGVNVWGIKKLIEAAYSQAIS